MTTREHILQNTQMKVLHNQISMMAVRGFDLTPEDQEFERMYNQIIAMAPKKRPLINLGINEPKLYINPATQAQCYVIYIFSTGKVKQEDLAKALSQIIQQYGSEISHLILILNELNTSADNELLKIVQDISSQPRLEIFSFDDLITTPVEHILMPEYRWLAPDEIKSLKANLKGNNLSSFFQLKPTDKLVRYFDRVKGDILATDGENPVNGIPITNYWLVV